MKQLFIPCHLLETNQTVLITYAVGVLFIQTIQMAVTTTKRKPQAMFIFPTNLTDLLTTNKITDHLTLCFPYVLYTLCIYISQQHSILIHIYLVDFLGC